ncbi:MAG: hypothetical protein U0990_12760 [Candidatus Nanopelagicales bacterium]|nr:hypothetical protein [Candidatus Nanopelagicales bacterium]
MTEPRPLYLVPVANGCEDRLFLVTVPVTFKVRALDKVDVQRRAKVLITIDGCEGEIATGIPDIQEISG